MSTDPNRLQGKSAAEMARELLAKRTPGKWRVWSREETGIRVSTLDGHGGMDQIALVCSFDKQAENAALIAESPALIEQLLQDLSAATERAERAEKEAEEARARARHWEYWGNLHRDGHRIVSEWWWGAICVATNLQNDLATSRAAHDKLKEWALLARPVVEAVHCAQKHDEADPTDPWSPLHSIALPEKDI